MKKLQMMFAAALLVAGLGLTGAAGADQCCKTKSQTGWFTGKVAQSTCATKSDAKGGDCCSTKSDAKGGDCCATKSDAKGAECCSTPKADAKAGCECGGTKKASCECGGQKSAACKCKG